jgi:hypothetical protein
MCVFLWFVGAVISLLLLLILDAIKSDINLAADNGRLRAEVEMLRRTSSPSASTPPKAASVPGKGVNNRSAQDDMRDYGTGFEIDGERIDPSRITIYTKPSDAASVPVERLEALGALWESRIAKIPPQANEFRSGKAAAYDVCLGEIEELIAEYRG